MRKHTIIIDWHKEPDSYVGFAKKKNNAFTAYKCGWFIVYFFNMNFSNTMDYICFKRSKDV